MYRLWGVHLGSPVPEWLPAWPGEPSPPGPSSLLPPPAGAGPEGSHCPTVASAPAREAKATNFTVPGDGQRPGTSWEVSTGHRCRLTCPGESPQHTDPRPPRLNRGPAPRWDAGMSGRQRCSAQPGACSGCLLDINPTADGGQAGATEGLCTRGRFQVHRPFDLRMSLSALAGCAAGGKTLRARSHTDLSPGRQQVLKACGSRSPPLCLAAVPALDGDCSLVYLMDEPVQRSRFRTRRGSPPPSTPRSRSC